MDVRTQDSRSCIPCRFFARAACRKGAACPFSHRRDCADAVDGNIAVPCRFFLQGNCQNDNKCPYKHANDYLAGATAEPEAEIPEAWIRELKGTLVRYDEGAAVAKVSFPSDFSAVRLNHLPQGTTLTSVTALLTSLGYPGPHDCIRFPPTEDACVADVQMEDPQFAEQLCDRLAKWPGPIKAVTINMPIPQAKDHRRVDAKKVFCSWHKPTKTVWLNFGSGDIATKISSRFSDGSYKVLGQSVTCQRPTCGAGHGNHLAWTVKLSGVPAFAGTEDVLADVPAWLRPGRVEPGTPSYPTSFNTASKMIHAKLLKTGPLERWTLSTETSGKRFKATARFKNDADARQAVSSLNSKPLPFNTNGRLTLQLVYSAKFKVSTRIYDAVRPEVEHHKSAWTAWHLRYTEYPPAYGFRVLKLEGDAGEVVANAKAVLEKILAGELMTKDGEAIWAASFATNGDNYRKIKALERQLGIVIIRDKRKSQLRVFGPPLAREGAEQSISELAEQDSSSTFFINLGAAELPWLFKGGYRAVTSAVGVENVTLDIVSNPRRIVVAGSEAHYNRIQHIILHKERKLEDKSGPDAIVAECAICWTEVENPVRTSCEHVYCDGCFEDLCSARADSGSIRCQGCDKVLSLDEIQKHLSLTALDNILDKAFTAHVARNPDKLRYCPTPDCGHVYRPYDDKIGPSQSLWFMCSKCFVAVCTVCHTCHDGFTCAEHRDLASGGYKALQRVKEELGIKACPKCGVLIEKTFGCNHMTCATCNAHICWVCMKVFNAGALVYDHMQKEHGGIGVEYYPGLH